MTLLEQLVAKYVTGADKENARALVAILAKADETEGTRCWIWTGAKGADGYGNVRYRGTVWRAHRAAYTILVGAIESGLELDHLCRVRACVNPDHLEPVTGEENIRRHQHAVRKPLGGDLPTQTLAAVISVMADRNADRMHTADVLDALNRRDATAYDGWTAEHLAIVLSQAGISRRATQIKIDGVNRAGWRLVDLLARTTP